MPFRWSVFVVCFLAGLTPREKAQNVQSFEVVWTTVRDRHPDRTFNGLNWQAIHDATRPLVERAASMDEARNVMRQMLAKLGSSHYAIIPKELYTPAGDTAALPKAADSPDTKPLAGPGAAPDSPAAASTAKPSTAKPPKDADESGKQPDAALTQPEGKRVTFGNLPESRLYFESRRLPSGAGYIRFNEFLDPVSIMPRFEAAIKEFGNAPGIILDLRGNPGGIGIMAMGIAGFFVAEQGRKLGEMKMRDATLNLVIFPRPEPYTGKLAILVDAGSASTTEILAQGMQDLGRARIFGTRTAGAALPSDIVRLPNGDGFQFAQASYTSANGKVLEGAGVTPDVEIRQTPEALSAGRDLVIEAAEAWIR